MEEVNRPQQDSTTTKTISNIRKSLAANLKNKYNLEDEEYIDSFMKMHGLHKSNFDFVHNVEKLINEKLNDISIDDNSNKNEKTIESMNQEVMAPVKKAVGFDYLYREMKELYGKEEASRLIGEILDLSLGLSDSTQILKPYCWCIDASKIVTIGKPFGQLNSKPSKKVQSYIGNLSETVHQIQNHLAGAVAIGTLFLDMAHLLMYEHKYTLEQVKSDKFIRKSIENEFQQFVHSMNHLSRSSSETPFTNISIFDREKLSNLINDENYGWYFEKDEAITNDYTIKFIMEVQNIFLDFFDKGDPTKDGRPYRFPIVTINLSKKMNKETGKNELVDIKFFKSICKRDIYRYNIFTSEGTKVASCCRLTSDKEMLELAGQTNSFGGTSISLGSHRVVTINFNRIALESKNEEKFWNLLDERIESAAKILKAHKDLLKRLNDRGLQFFIKEGWIVMSRMFSTFGILGIYEMAKTFQEKYNCPKRDITKEVLIHLNEKMAEMNTKYSIISNCEQIPGESFAIRLAFSDRQLYGEKKVPYRLYANQFVPLWEDADLFEKMEIDGKYNKLLTGGGIVHAQIGERVEPEIAERIILFAVECGCEHFALNAVYSECEKGHNTMGKVETCPHCGANIVEYMTRVVGFFTPVSSWSKERREWEFPERKFINISDRLTE